MNLDLAALTPTLSAQSQRKSWGQLGTWGTPRYTRGFAVVGIGDGAGTTGDDCTAKVAIPDRRVGPSAVSPAECPRTSPCSPLYKVTEASNEIGMSPLSPNVPDTAGMNATGKRCDQEAFDERTAIMEFDGAMTRVDAEAATLALPGTKK